MITILDYGEGNIRNVERAFQKLGQSVTVTNEKNKIEKATTLVVPGQGAFKQAMTQLKKLNLIDPIKNHIKEKKKFLGICLGFQILFETSEEHGTVEGLKIVPGHFKKINVPNFKVPHMGWNQIKTNQQSVMFNNIAPKSYVYFVHSYYVEQTKTEIISSTTHYGNEFVSAIEDSHLWATQFHPEKSGDIGLEILKNFITF
tara:strand:- start:264 stop:866 length:603 start_codon:yes stop_codon:yes gene_type:complete